MSRKGGCWDNAVVESFFGSLKQERVHWRNYQTHHEVQQDISIFYNGQLLHSYLGYMNPNNYEKQLLERKKGNYSAKKLEKVLDKVFLYFFRFQRRLPTYI
ncbi:MAG: integrase core domain-containing protein, partial [Candidatus Thiodiazotropha sp. (ex Lucinoma aequizonata)]|nr:integrase core domain-containing protein [Candidatus Thiodiazotropha sp. (ex Lucinoma aequizonata)]